MGADYKKVGCAKKERIIMPFAEGVFVSLTATLIWNIQKLTCRILARVFFRTDRRMEGIWLTVFADEGSIHEETVEAVQLGKWVCGRIQYHEKRRLYAFSGTIQGDVLVAMYETFGHSSVRDRGSFTLAGNPVGELLVLDGCYAWTDDRTQRPRADGYIWVKQGDIKIPDRVTSHRSDIKGTGVFTTRKFAQGEILGYFEGSPIDYNTKHSLTLDARIIEPVGVLRSLNHSCKPNARFRDRWLVAEQDIGEDKEVTIDYMKTESMITDGFDCDCQTQNCRGHIGP